MIESELHIAAVGYVPETKGMAFPSRHLGLMMPEEIRDLQKQIADFADILEKTIDISELCAIAQQAPVLTLSFEDQEDHSDKDNETVRLAVARDEAFCFYYEDNLEMLRALGAEIVYFSAMRVCRKISVAFIWVVVIRSCMHAFYRKIKPCISRFARRWQLACHVWQSAAPTCICMKGWRTPMVVYGRWHRSSKAVP
jgi:hypothetical protein